MSVHAFSSPGTDPITEAKIDLAAALRLAVVHELEEGIDNHFTMTVPDTADRFLVLPFGLHWSEARAGNLITFNEQGDTLEGEGLVEISARCIHAPIHRITGTRVVLHTHQTWAVALNMLENNRLLPTCQTSAFLVDHIAYDDNYSGTADTLDEGERLAGLLADKTVLFMKNHGVLVAGNTMAAAYHKLHMLERVCRAQVLAMATGQRLSLIPPEVVTRVQLPDTNDRHRGQRDQLYFSAMKRVLDRVNPGYAE